MHIPETRSEDLPPMRVNTVTMFLIGIVLWILGLAVVLVLRAMGYGLDGVVQICLTGIGIGVLALAWAVPQHRRAVRREREREAGARSEVEPG
ncbi:DUF2530 domain-containing protein [Georgenia sp. H159]|uniref:DUF2530 domain-containing protein n=1 Tax=Georgenia sp. H159 TaxID=3076115 RepID=UPI002D770E0A|nr:DUF2530 domain-containing protein [Georgenia sp. H159]